MVAEQCYLKNSTEGESTKYNIFYLFYINFFSNNKKCVLWLLNKKTIKKENRTHVNKECEY